LGQGCHATARTYCGETLANEEEIARNEVIAVLGIGYHDSGRQWSRRTLKYESLTLPSKNESKYAPRKKNALNQNGLMKKLVDMSTIDYCPSHIIHTLHGPCGDRWPLMNPLMLSSATLPTPAVLLISHFPPHWKLDYYAGR
jgi:hypothetical protein